MPRPKRGRRIRDIPGITFFKPQGIPLRDLESIDLSLDEYEAVRLKYSENKDNAASAKLMKISSSTFQRILTFYLLLGMQVTETIIRWPKNPDPTSTKPL